MKLSSNNQQPTTNNRNHFLNFLKGIGCIGVVFIHVVFPGEFGRAISKLAQFAVPIFLMISGFYAYSENECLENNLHRKTKKIFIITIWALAVYFFFSCVTHIKNNNLFSFLQDLFSLKNVLKMFLVQNFDVLSASHLWFLPALLFCYIFMNCVVKLNHYWPILKYLHWLLPFLFLIHSVVSVFTDSMWLSWHYKGNFIVSALLWFLFGNLIAKNKYAIVKKLPRMCKLLTFCLLFALSAVLLNLFIPNFAELFVVPYALLLFLIAVTNPNKITCNIFEHIGEKYSLNVYVFHILIYRVFLFLTMHFHIDSFFIYEWLKPIAVSCLTLAFSIALDFTKNKLFKNQ